MKIVFFETDRREEAFLRKNLKAHTLYFSKSELNRKNAKKFSFADAVCVFIYSKIDAKVLDAMPNLKLICTMSTGFDHVGIDECRKRKVMVSNVPTYGENTVAEHTFALLLALSRKIHLSYERTKSANFSAHGLEGFDLKGRTIGVVGCGNIGRHVVRIARGFEMNVLVHERHRDAKLARRLGFKEVSLDRLYKGSDIITFHVPLTKSTRHMFGKSSLSKVKRGCIILNTSRGEIIDTEALMKGLSNGTIWGAGLDVLEGECYIREEKEVISSRFPQECDLRAVLRNHVLVKEPNVLITPHNAFNSREAIERILKTTVANIDSFANGKKLNAV